MSGPVIFRMQREGMKGGVACSSGQEKLLGKGSFDVGLRRWVILCKTGFRLDPGGSELPGFQVTFWCFPGILQRP